MLSDGAFQAKKYRFLFYISKKHAFDLSPDDMDCFVVHPPPYNILTLLLALFLPFKTFRKRISNKIDIVIFWFDNLVITFMLIIVELILLPLCYVKIMA